MKNISKLLLAVFTLSIFFVTGCNNSTEPKVKPVPPRNVYTVTGNKKVNVYWDHVDKGNINYYKVYVSTNNNKFSFIGTSKGFSYLDNASDVKNGEKYYYAVVAVSYNGTESELSKENAYSTPRPQGLNESINNFIQFPATSGFSLLSYKPVHFLVGKKADFFYEYDTKTGKYFMNVWMDTDIADMGGTKNIHDIKVAPKSGWSIKTVTINDTLKAKYVEIAVGKTYVIHTHDNFYGKIRINDLRKERVFFDWAFMDSKGNMELEKRNYSIRKVPELLHGSKITTKRN